jgi:hypothetical protein
VPSAAYKTYGNVSIFTVLPLVRAYDKGQIDKSGGGSYEAIASPRIRFEPDRSSLKFVATVMA